MTRALRSAAAAVFAGVLIGWLFLGGCHEAPESSTDAGSEAISDCCDYFLVPLYFDEPQVCLQKLTPPGECRWLTCLGGLVRYTACTPAD